MTNFPRNGWIGVILCCCVTGCFAKTAQGDVSTYRYAFWVGPLVVLGGLASAWVGWRLHRRRWFLGWGLLTVGPITSLALAPGYFLNHVSMDSEHFEIQRGFWFAPIEHKARFDELSKVNLSSDEVVHQRGGRTSVTASDYFHWWKWEVTNDDRLEPRLREKKDPYARRLQFGEETMIFVPNWQLDAYREIIARFSAHEGNFIRGQTRTEPRSR